MKSISTVRAKFLRSKIKAKFTVLFEDMDEIDKNFIIKNISLLNKETLILVFFPQKSYWWTLSNSRLIINNNSILHYLTLSEIEKVEINEIFEGTSTKESFITLSLIHNNESIKLRVEENTWHIIYNIIKFVIN